MDEEDVISEPNEELPQYDTDGSLDEKSSTPPKNPNGTEAFLIVSILGVLPDVIDFFSIGAFSFVSSLLSWPITEYYFSQKNLKVPNIKKWIRVTNLGDVIPFVGALPLKTIGLLAAIYMAWHPDSALTKSAQALDAAAGGKKATPSPKKAAVGKSIQESKILTRGQEAMGRLPGYEEEGAGEAGKDIYEEIREGGGGLKGPEEEAEAEAFGEIISTPPLEEEAEASIEPQQKTPSRPPAVSSNINDKPKRPAPANINPPAESVEEKSKIEERLNIGAVEREIKEKLTSPEAVMEDRGIPTTDSERGVDLSGKK